MSGSTSAHTAPVTRFTRPSRSPLSVAIVSSASTATSCFLAKPIAAGDHSPSFVFAAAMGGPNISCFVSAAFMATSETITVKRLGVANTFASPWLRLWLCRPSQIPAHSASAMPTYSPAGSSSVPSSNKTVSVLTLQPPSPVSLMRLRQGLRQLGGNQALHVLRRSLLRLLEQSFAP